jgi:hypothetical protein
MVSPDSGVPGSSIETIQLLQLRQFVTSVHDSTSSP